MDRVPGGAVDGSGDLERQAPLVGRHRCGRERPVEARVRRHPQVLLDEDDRGVPRTHPAGQGGSVSRSLRRAQRGRLGRRVRCDRRRGCRVRVPGQQGRPGPGRDPAGSLEAVELLVLLDGPAGERAVVAGGRGDREGLLDEDHRWSAVALLQRRPQGGGRLRCWCGFRGGAGRGRGQQGRPGLGGDSAGGPEVVELLVLLDGPAGEGAVVAGGRGDGQGLLDEDHRSPLGPLHQPRSQCRGRNRGQRRGREDRGRRALDLVCHRTADRRRWRRHCQSADKCSAQHRAAQDLAHHVPLVACEVSCRVRAAWAATRCSNRDRLLAGPQGHLTGRNRWLGARVDVGPPLPPCSGKHRRGRDSATSGVALDRAVADVTNVTGGLDSPSCRQ